MSEPEEAVRALLAECLRYERELGPCQECGIVGSPEWRRVAAMLGVEVPSE